jgi:hypothetical protein
MQLGENGHQFYGQIVDAIKTHVFESFENGAFSGAGETGENYQMAGVVSIALIRLAAGHRQP